MLTNIRLPELLIILVIIVLLFGVGRLTKIGGEMGGAIRSFKKGIKGEDETTPAEEEKKEDK